MRNKLQMHKEFQWDFSVLPAPWLEDLMSNLDHWERRDLFVVSKASSQTVLANTIKSNCIARIGEQPVTSHVGGEGSSAGRGLPRASKQSATGASTTSSNCIIHKPDTRAARYSSRNKWNFLADLSQYARSVTLHVTKNDTKLVINIPQRMRPYIRCIILESDTHPIGNADIKALGLAHLPRLQLLKFEGNAGFGPDCQRPVPPKVMPRQMPQIELCDASNWTGYDDDESSAQAKHPWDVRTCALWLARHVHSLRHEDIYYSDISSPHTLSGLDLFSNLKHSELGYTIKDVSARPLFALPSLEYVTVGSFDLLQDWTQADCLSKWKQLTIETSVCIRSIANLPLQHIQKVAFRSLIFMPSEADYKLALSRLQGYDGLHIVSRNRIAFGGGAVDQPELADVVACFKAVSNMTYECYSSGHMPTDWSVFATLPPIIETVLFRKIGSRDPVNIVLSMAAAANGSTLKRIQVKHQKCTYSEWERRVKAFHEQLGDRNTGPIIEFHGSVSDNTPWLRLNRPRHYMPAEIATIAEQVALRQLAARCKVTLTLGNLYDPDLKDYLDQEPY